MIVDQAQGTAITSEYTETLSLEGLRPATAGRRY